MTYALGFYYSLCMMPAVEEFEMSVHISVLNEGIWPLDVQEIHMVSLAMAIVPMEEDGSLLVIETIVGDINAK